MSTNYVDTSASTSLDDIIVTDNSKVISDLQRQNELLKKEIEMMQEIINGH